MVDSSRFREQTAIVTGGAQGIGLATARRLAAEGAAVLICDIRADEGRRAVERLNDEGHKAVFTETDVADPGAVEDMVGTCLRELGPPTVLINNAGVAITGNPVELSETDWRRSFAVDLDALWFTARCVIPHFQEHGAGNIVNIASVHSFKIIKGYFPYPVAKHAVIGLTRALAIEYADQNIRVNAICPGAIDTPINIAIWEKTGDAAAERRRWEEAHPQKRIGTADEVAAAVAFMASPEAAFITGESLVMDGGLSVLYMD